MSDNLIDLVKNNYFSLNEKENESQITAYINEKCINHSISETLNDMLDEINVALNSDYVTKKGFVLKDKESKTKSMISEIIHLKDKIGVASTSSSKISEKSLKLVDEIRAKFVEITKKEEEYENIIKLEKLKELMSSIQSSIVIGDNNLAAEYMGGLIKELSHEESLVDTFKDDLHFYHSLIKTELSKSFREGLNEIKWPFISPGLSHAQIDVNKELIDNNTEKLSNLFNQLLMIELPPMLLKDNEKPQISIDFLSDKATAPVPYPIELLLGPFVKYFNQYFWKDNKLNKISKPEWYINQALQWMSIHQSALSLMFVDSLFEKVDIRVEFNRGIVLMVMEKVCRDLPLARKDDNLFFHLIEESLTMCIILGKNYDYPKSCPSIVDVICDPANENDYFSHWMHLEHVFAMRQMDELFLSGCAWNSLSSLTIRVECLSVFSNLLGAMKERIECVTNLEKQYNFVQVLLEILGDFRLRLVQVAKQQTTSDSRRTMDVMNVLHGICVLLRSWKMDQTFMSVYDYELNGANQNKTHPIRTDSEIENTEIQTSQLLPPLSVSTAYLQRTHQCLTKPSFTPAINCPDNIFHLMLQLYKHNLELLQDACCSTIYDDIVDRALAAYTSSGQSLWLLSLNKFDSKLSSATISNNSAEFLLVLRDRLHLLHSLLEPPLFEEIWQSLAQRLNEFFYLQIILQHRFSEYGGHQLDHDIRHGLVTLFSGYTRTPQRYFLTCLEACSLLTINWGTAVLLKQLLLSENSPDASYVQALQDIGVFNISPDEALSILQLRVDPTLNH